MININARETVNHNIFRYIKYSFVGFIGFIVVEVVSYITLATDFNELIGVSIGYMLSIFVTFVINSVFTVRSGFSARPKIPVDKLHLFVISGILANAGYIGFQYVMYADFSLTPLIGNLLAGAFITPTNYYYRMRKVFGKRVIF